MGAYLELRRGIGEPSFIPLSAGKELTIGRRGMWRVEAAGVLDVHAYVYFDGASLFVQSHDPSTPVRVNGQDVGTDWLPLDRSCDIELAGALVGYAADQAHADPEEATSIYDNAPIAAPPPAPAPLPPEQQTVAIAQPAPIPPVNMRSTMAMDDAPRPAAPSGRPPPRNPNGPPPPPAPGGFANRPFPQPPGANRPAEDSGATRLQPLPVPAPSAPAVRPAAGAPLPRMATGPSPVVQVAEDPLRATHFQPAVPPQNPGMMPMQPGMMQPGMMQPPMGMQPGMMQPMGMQPGMMQPGMMQPGMMQPGMGMQPGMMQPGMMQPGMGMPPGMDPNMMPPGMMQPQMGMQPGMMQPGMGMPPGMDPNMMPPGMMQPGMMQPGMMQPGMGMPPGMPGAQLPAAAPGAKPSYAEQWKALSIPRKISILLSPFVLIACIDIFFFDEEEPAPTVTLDAGAKPSADAASTATTTASTPPTMIVPPVFPDASFVEPPPVQDAGTAVPPPTGPTATPTASASVVKPADTTPKPMPTVRTLERQAADAYAAGRYEEAALLYDQLASQYPNDPTYKEIARIIRRRMSAPPQPK